MNDRTRKSCADTTVVFLVFLSLFFLACSMEPPAPQKSQLELRQMQTREYKAPPGGLKRVMKAVINTLQDEGYMIKNADIELGFITAQRETDVQDKWETFFAHLGAGNNAPARFSKNSVLECSVNVSEYGKDMRVRAVFQNKVLDNLGGTVTVRQVDSGLFYQNFFSKVDKGIFIERQGL